MRRRVFWKGEDAEEYVYKEEPAVERRDEAATEDSGFWMLMRRKLVWLKRNRRNSCYK